MRLLLVSRSILHCNVQWVCDYANKQSGDVDWLAGWRTWQVTCAWLDTATADWFRVQLLLVRHRYVVQWERHQLSWWCHVMSRLIRFISARWTRRGRGRATPGGGSGGVPCVTSVSTSTTTNERLCCRVSLLDGTDMIVDLPVSYFTLHSTLTQTDRQTDRQRDSVSFVSVFVSQWVQGIF